MSDSTHPIVVGVLPGDPGPVIRQAAVFARRFGTELVCVWVDPARYVVEETPDGVVRTSPLDPDLEDDDVEQRSARLREVVAQSVPAGVDWTFRVLAGDAARALAHLADRVDAAMIVVGTREAGFRGTFREFFSGSVAAHLAHRQHRPVVVIPLDPVGADSELPWVGEQ